MADFSFLQDPVSKKWVSLSPRREIRPNAQESKEHVVVCPFCPIPPPVIASVAKQSQPSVISNEVRDLPGVGTESAQEISREARNDKGEENSASGTFGTFDTSDTSPDWLVRVLPNKFPFASIHEVIIHSPDHHKSFGELPLDQGERILQALRKQYNEYKDKGTVVIFNNSGEGSGQSLPHPHTQLAVIPAEITLDIIECQIGESMFVDAGKFRLGCPQASQWPDEVWFVPKETGKTFGEITDEEIVSLAQGLDRLVKIYSHRYGHEFPFNFYIRPGLDWYLRLIPRVKTIGGFEIGTGVFVNTHDPKETIAFLKEHWQNPDFEKIKNLHQRNYSPHL